MERQLQHGLPRGTSPVRIVLLVRAFPTADDEAFVDALAQRGVFVLPGVLFETPGYFRMSLTATEEMIQRGLPVFAEAFAKSLQAKESAP